MSYHIQDPEETEQLLRNAGFCVGVDETQFVVYLRNREITRSEVALVLGCESEDLAISKKGILVG
jgi:exosome complex RNA-binding protein Rrp42 (RNase PH superfamily)